MSSMEKPPISDAPGAIDLESEKIGGAEVESNEFQELAAEAAERGRISVYTSWPAMEVQSVNGSVQHVAHLSTVVDPRVSSEDQRLMKDLGGDLTSLLKRDRASDYVGSQIDQSLLEEAVDFREINTAEVVRRYRGGGTLEDFTGQVGDISQPISVITYRIKNSDERSFSDHTGRTNDLRATMVLPTELAKRVYGMIQEDPSRARTLLNSFNKRATEDVASPGGELKPIFLDAIDLPTGEGRILVVPLDNRDAAFTKNPYGHLDGINPEAVKKVSYETERPVKTWAEVQRDKQDLVPDDSVLAPDAEKISGSGDTVVFKSGDTGINLDNGIKPETLPSLPRHKAILEKVASRNEIKTRGNKVDELMKRKFQGNLEPFLEKFEFDFIDHPSAPEDGKVKILDAYFNERAQFDLRWVLGELHSGKTVNSIFEQTKAISTVAGRRERLRAIETLGARVLHLYAPVDRKDWDNMHESQRVVVRWAEQLILRTEIETVRIKMKNESPFTKPQWEMLVKHFTKYQDTVDISDDFRSRLKEAVGWLNNIQSPEERKQKKDVNSRIKDEAWTARYESPLNEKWRKQRMDLEPNDYDVQAQEPLAVVPQTSDSLEPEALPGSKRFGELVEVQSHEEDGVKRILETGKVPEKVLEKLGAIRITDDKNSLGEARFIAHLANQMEDVALERQNRSRWDRFFTFNLLRKFNARRQVLGFWPALGGTLYWPYGRKLETRINGIRRKVGGHVDQVADSVQHDERNKAQYRYLADWLKQ